MIVRLVADTAGNFVVGLVKGLVALRHVRPCVAGWPAAAAGLSAKTGRHP